MDRASVSNCFLLWDKIARLYQHLHKLREADLRRNGSTVFQMAVLHLLSSLAKKSIIATPTLVSKLLLRKPSTITGALDRLEKQRLIYRDQLDYQKKEKQIKLTDAGKGVVEEARKVKSLVPIFSKLSSKEINKLNNSLDILIDIAKHEFDYYKYIVKKNIALEY